jgi:hypothetical protein
MALVAHSPATTAPPGEVSGPGVYTGKSYAQALATLEEIHKAGVDAYVSVRLNADGSLKQIAVVAKSGSKTGSDQWTETTYNQNGTVVSITSGKSKWADTETWLFAESE